MIIARTGCGGRSIGVVAEAGEGSARKVGLGCGVGWDGLIVRVRGTGTRGNCLSAAQSDSCRMGARADARHTSRFSSGRQHFG